VPIEQTQAWLEASGVLTRTDLRLWIIEQADKAALQATSRPTSNS